MSTRQSDQSSQEFFPPPPAVGIGMATELETIYPTSRVIDVADGRVISTPDRPDFRDGNQTFLNRPPESRDQWEWRAATAFKEHGVDFVQIAWEEPLGSSDQILSSPFQTESDVVLTRSRDDKKPRDANATVELSKTGGAISDVSIHELQTDSDFDALVEQRTAVDRDQGECAEFSRWFSEAAVSQVRQGRARWFGVRDRAQLISTAGLVVTSAGLRFQEVMTHPKRRREGWATKLLQSMIAESSQEYDEQHVIVAAVGSPAEGMYRGLGFSPVSRLVTALARRDESLDH